MRYITFSWDDGVRISTLRTAEIFEKRGLRTEFNVMASQSINDPTGRSGDFTLWNELQERGHVIQPHGWMHADKSKMPFEEARDLILRCLDTFQERLQGFEPARSIFGFPYHASTPQLEAWLPSVVRAYRNGPGPVINPLPSASTVRLTAHAEGEAEAWMTRCVNDILAAKEAWLLHVGHSLDGDGWGPVRGEFLERTLDRILAQDSVALLPTCRLPGFFP